MTNYTVTVEKVRPSQLGRCDKRLHFEVSRNVAAPDSNNNFNKTCNQNLASFDLLEDEIHSIRIAPVKANKFNVEFMKCSGYSRPNKPLLKASKSASVLVIHRRNGKFMDSKETFVPILKNPLNNRVPPSHVAKFSTFRPVKTKEGQSKEVLDNVAVSNSTDCHIITEVDLTNFCRFNFTFKPLVESSIRKAESDLEISIKEPCESESPEVIIVEAIDANSTGPDLITTEPLTTAEIRQTHDDPVPLTGSVSFQTVIDDEIALTIEFKNSIFEEKRKACLLGDESANPILRMEAINRRTYSEVTVKCQGIQDENANAIVKYGSTIPHSENPIRLLTLKDFVKSMVAQRLQSLGVQQLDCSDILDSWQSRQRGTNCFFAWPDDNLCEERVRVMDPLSPYVSQPNSSLFRLTPSGHISRSIFSTFVHQVDSLKGIINSATCTLIQTSIHLLLPEIKLLCARQLDTNSNPIFIQEWIRLILLAAKELKPFTPDDVAVMVNRELKALKGLSESLHQATKKICRKIGKLTQLSEAVFRKTLVRLHPKSLRCINAFDQALRKSYAPDVIHYDPSKLHNIELKSGDLFRDHMFISETVSGELLVKNDIDGFWDKFLDLEYSDRRLIFLALTEELQSALRRSLNDIRHLQEIYTEGYPGSIKKLLNDVVEELKFTSKRDDLTLLIKTSIVTHINYLHETLARLFCVSEEVNGITKTFHRSLQNASFNPAHQKKHQLKKERKILAGKSNPSTMTTIGTGIIRGYHTEVAAGIHNSRPLLVVPLSRADEIFTR